MRVCRLRRATSYLFFFIASMARSNRTLSGCLESTWASGFLTFLLVHATAEIITNPSSIAIITRRNIPYHLREKLDNCEMRPENSGATPSASWPRRPLSIAFARSHVHHLCRKRHCPLPVPQHRHG